MTANYRYLGKNVPSVWQLTCFNISKESLILCKEKKMYSCVPFSEAQEPRHHNGCIYEAPAAQTASPKVAWKSLQQSYM